MLYDVQYFDRTLLLTRVFVPRSGSRCCNSVVLRKDVAGSLPKGSTSGTRSRGAMTVDQGGRVPPSDASSY